MRDPQPTISDEQRVLLMLSDKLAAERAADKERQAAERAARVQETLVNVLPPRRTQENIEQERERLKELASDAEASSCVVQ